MSVTNKKDSIMKKKRIVKFALGGMLLGFTAYAGFYTYNRIYSDASVDGSTLLLENIEALALFEDDEEKPVTCPEPYDVPDNRFTTVQKTGTFTISGEVDDTYIIIGGIKIPFSGTVGGSVTITYEVGDCTYSRGACCPYKRIGEIKIL